MYLSLVIMLLGDMGRYQKAHPSLALMQVPLAMLPDSLIIVVSLTSLFSVFWTPTMTLDLLELCYLLQITLLLCRLDPFGIYGGFT